MTRDHGEGIGSSTIQHDTRSVAGKRPGPKNTLGKLHTVHQTTCHPLTQRSLPVQQRTYGRNTQPGVAGYTSTDRRRVKRAVNHLKNWQHEEEEMIDRITKVSMADSSPLPESSPERRRPFRRLVRDPSTSSSEELQEEVNDERSSETPVATATYVEDEARVGNTEKDREAISRAAEQVVDNSMDSTGHIIIGDRSDEEFSELGGNCLLYTSPSPRDYAASRMPSSA